MHKVSLGDTLSRFPEREGGESLAESLFQGEIKCRFCPGHGRIDQSLSDKVRAKGAS